MYKAMDDDPNPRLVHLMHDISRYKNHDSILIWLIRNNMTGKTLVQWLDGAFRGSIMSMVKHVIMKFNKEKRAAPIMYGKDWT